MPCESPKQSCEDIESQELAQMLGYLLPSLGKATPTWIMDMSEDWFWGGQHINEMTVMLCDLCKNLTPEESEMILYARNKRARMLANWWEDHQEHDRRREEAEAKADNKSALRKQALAKLTPEEREALL